MYKVNRNLDETKEELNKKVDKVKEEVKKEVNHKVNQVIEKVDGLRKQLASINYMIE